MHIENRITVRLSAKDLRQARTQEGLSLVIPPNTAKLTVQIEEGVLDEAANVVNGKDRRNSESWRTG